MGTSTHKRASRVADYIDGDVMHTVQHERYIDWFIDAGDRLRRAMEAH